MILHSLTLRNFRQHAESAIHFERGVTGIIGTNGAGKSTILEALSYALFGAEAIRGTKGSIRWNRAPARRQAEVVLEFTVNGQRYVVRRSESDASVDVLDGNIASGTSVVNACIPTLLGMQYREFAASYLCAQKDLMRLASMGGTERQAFYRNVMGIGRVDEAVKAARQARNDLARQRDGLAAGLGERLPYEADEAEAVEALRAASREFSTYGVELILKEERHETCQAYLADWTERRNEHDRLTREIQQAEREIAETSAEVDRLTARIEEAERAAVRVAQDEMELGGMEALRRERDSFIEARATAREVQGLATQMREAEAAVSLAEEKIADAEQQVAHFDEKRFGAIGNRLSAIDDRVAALQRERELKIHQHHARRASLVQERHRVRKKVEAIRAAGLAGSCPTCMRELGEQYDTVLATLEVEDEELEREITTEDLAVDELSHPGDEEAGLEAERAQLDEEYDHLKIGAADALRARESIRQWTAVRDAKRADVERTRLRWAQLQEVTFDPEMLAAAERAIAHGERMEKELVPFRALAAQKKGLLRERSLWLEKNSAAVNRSGHAMADLLTLAFDSDKYAQLAVAAAEAQQSWDAAKVAHAKAEQAMHGAEDRLRRARFALEQYDYRARKLDDITERLRVANLAAERLSDFRTSVASGIRPELEELCSGFVSLLTDGRFEAVTLSEDFECRLYRGGVGMEVISGGEEDVAAVAMRLATSQMIAERAGHPLSLLILDEPFGSQDEVRRGNMMALFRRLESVFPQIILISHVPEAQNQVDHAVMIDFDEALGCSAVRCLTGAGV